MPGPPASSGPQRAPSLRESFGKTRTAFRALIRAHLDLLRAELDVTLKELQLIIGLAAGALGLAILLVLLVFIGSALFLGEWLFGSIFWGVLDGALLLAAIILPIGVNLAGGWVGAWVRGLAVSIVFGVILGVGFWLWASNGATWIAQTTLAIDKGALVWIMPGLIVGVGFGIVLGLVGLLVGGRQAILLLLGGFVVGFLSGGILGIGGFNKHEAVAIAFTIALITFLMVCALLAVRHKFDPQARYDKLVPRETMAQVAATRAYLGEQWQRQRKKLAGR